MAFVVGNAPTKGPAGHEKTRPLRGGSLGSLALRSELAGRLAALFVSRCVVAHHALATAVMLSGLVLALLRCGNVRPDCAGLAYFDALCVARVRLCCYCFLAAFLAAHCVFPPIRSIGEPLGNSGNIRLELS